ncbi:MAG: c-type cytochrome [Marinobacter sp.]
MKALKNIKWSLVGGLIMAAPALFMSQAVQAEIDAAGYFQLRCASCHGTEGQGTEDKAPALAPALKGNQLVMHAPAQTIVGIIRNGRAGQQRVYEKFPNMPAFGPVMVPDPEGLVKYLKNDLQKDSNN